jgi:hypothetical protein
MGDHPQGRSSFCTRLTYQCAGRLPRCDIQNVFFRLSLAPLLLAELCFVCKCIGAFGNGIHYFLALHLILEHRHLCGTEPLVRSIHKTSVVLNNKVVKCDTPASLIGHMS